MAVHDGTIVGIVAEGYSGEKSLKRFGYARALSGFTEDRSIEAVARVLAAPRLEIVPVVRDNTVVGIISQDDVFCAAAMESHVALQAPVNEVRVAIFSRSIYMPTGVIPLWQL